MKEEPLPISARFKQYLRGLVFRVLIYLTVYFVIAFLTIGPFFWSWYAAVHVHGSIWVAKFYAPLLWLCDHCEPLSRLVNAYIRWWIL